VAFRNWYSLPLLNVVCDSHVISRHRPEPIQAVELDHVRNEDPQEHPRLFACYFDRRILYTAAITLREPVEWLSARAILPLPISESKQVPRIRTPARPTSLDAEFSPFPTNTSKHYSNSDTSVLADCL